MALYESEYTKFIREWKERHPEQIEEVKKGRALWWDKEPRDMESIRCDLEATIPRKSYYYDAN